MSFSRLRRRPFLNAFALLVAGAVTGASQFAAPPAYAIGSLKLSNELYCQVLYPCVPPARFQRGAFLAPPRIINVSMQQVQAICAGEVQAAGSPPSVMGCAQLANGACVVHISSKSISQDLYDLVLEHELGHCRGWVHG